MEREARAQQTRDAILDAAIELFVRHGYEQASMDAIALEAKVAKGTLYYHYDSKEGIVDAVMERYARTMEARLAAVEADRRLDFGGKFRAFVEALKQVNSATFSQLHRVRFIDIHEKTTRVMVERFAPFLARVIEEGNRTGQCHAEDPFEFAELLLAAGQSLLDPEVGEEKLPRRAAAMARIAARVLGVDAAELASAFRPSEGARRCSQARGHRR